MTALCAYPRRSVITFVFGTHIIITRRNPHSRYAEALEAVDQYF
jgi:hypothetical protein